MLVKITVGENEEKRNNDKICNIGYGCYVVMRNDVQPVSPNSFKLRPIFQRVAQYFEVLPIFIKRITF